MLEIRNLDVIYPGPPPYQALGQVSLKVDAGTTVGLVGESGSGKSTIARAVVGLVRVSGGSITLEGDDVTNARGPQLRALRRKVQLVFQDPAASLNPRMTVGDAVREAVAVATGVRLGSRAARDEALELFHRVELPLDVADRYPFQLSGGQLQRVAIARALATRPSMLLLDEVTASLDVSVQAVVLNLLRKLQKELHLTLLYISHDLSVIRYVSDRVLVMQQGRIVEEADVATMFAAAREPYTQTLLAAVPRLGGSRWRTPRGHAKFKEHMK